MSGVYTGFSNYKEINLQNRRKAAEKEIAFWGKDAERFKEYRLEWNRAANATYLPSRPLHVDIEVCNVCNLRCKMCLHGISKIKNPGFIDRNLLLQLIDQCAEIGVYSIKFNWRGEVLLYNFLPQAVKYAKEKGILEVQINTNGLPPLNNRGIILECAESGIDRVIFSVEGFSKQTYEFIREGGDYERLLPNIHELIDWKRRNNSVRPFIRVQMVRTKVNAHEVEDYIAYWQPLVNDVRISDVMDRGQGKKLSVGDQIAVGRRRCPQPFQRLAVARDGKVSPCCVDWNQELIVGDSNKQALIDIWKTDKMMQLRDLQNNNEQNKIAVCKRCSVKESYLWRVR